MNFFAGFRIASQAILEYVGQEAILKDAKKGAKSALFELRKDLMAVSSEHLSEKELVQQIQAASAAVEVGSLYTHYRDPSCKYRVVGFTIIEATQEAAVLYQKEAGSDELKSIVWARPLSSWIEKVSHEGVLVPRFLKVL